RIDDTALFIGEGVAATASVTADCTEEYPNLWNAPVYMWLQTNVTLANGSAVFPNYMHMLRTGLQQVRTSFCLKYSRWIRSPRRRAFAITSRFRCAGATWTHSATSTTPSF